MGEATREERYEQLLVVLESLGSRALYAQTVLADDVDNVCGLV